LILHIYPVGGATGDDPFIVRAFRGSYQLSQVKPSQINNMISDTPGEQETFSNGSLNDNPSLYS